MDCTSSHIPLEQQAAAMLRILSALVGLPIVEVPTNTHTENAMICGKFTHLSIEQMIKNSIGVDPCGLPAFRVKYINSCTPLINCATSNDPNPFNKMFAYDATLKTFAIVFNKST